jgi:hypothetical protein
MGVLVAKSLCVQFVSSNPTMAQVASWDGGECQGGSLALRDDIVVAGAPKAVTTTTIIRTPEDVLAVVLERNPRAAPFMHEGRMYMLYYDFYMAMCGGTLEAARQAKRRLVNDKPSVAKLIQYKQIGSEFIRATYCGMSYSLVFQAG